MNRRTLGRALSRALAFPFRPPDKNRDNALNRVLYSATDLSRGATLPTRESCFKYNIRDAMPSICYDDDSANEERP